MSLHFSFGHTSTLLLVEQLVDLRCSFCYPEISGFRMGHERVGVLPRTKRWSRIAEEISAFCAEKTGVEKLVRSTLRNVDSRFRRIHRDAGVKAAFEFLVALARGRGRPLQNTELVLSHNPTLIELAGALKHWVLVHRESAEYSGIAERAALDAVTSWISRYDQPALLGRLTSEEIWSHASTGAGFCEFARIFFARFTERYLNYFLDRVASAEVDSVSTREQLQQSLGSHVNDISLHAFETSKITQSFAAGWFNKLARQEALTQSQIQSFLGVAFGKIREELLLEARDE